MFNLNSNYNYIVDQDIAYSKNIIENNNYYIKNDYALVENSYSLEYINSNSFFIHLNSDGVIIKDLFIEFYNDINYSIFASNTDNTLDLISEKVNSIENKLFNINSEKKYSKLYIISNSEIINYIKNIKIYSSSNIQSNDKYAYIITRLKNLNKLTDIIILNDSNTQMYLYDYNTYLKVISDIGSNKKSEFINNNYKIEKNTNIKNNYPNEMYLLEFYNLNDNISSKTQIFGKEKIE